MALNADSWHEVLHYEDGILRWRIKPSHNVRVGDTAGKIGSNGYRHVGFMHKRYPAHRIIWVMHFGPIPEGYEIDHINHDRADNRVENLRLVSRLDNMKNKTSSKNNTSGVTGVHWSKTCKKWQAQITINGKHKHIGLFNDLHEAIAARMRAEVMYGFHKNHGAKTCL